MDFFLSKAYDDVWSGNELLMSITFEEFLNAVSFTDSEQDFDNAMAL